MNVKKTYIKIFIIINLIGIILNISLFYLNIPNGINIFLAFGIILKILSFILYVIFAIVLYKFINFLIKKEQEGIN